jgi:hypothetical protein
VLFSLYLVYKALSVAISSVGNEARVARNHASCCFTGVMRFYLVQYLLGLRYLRLKASIPSHFVLCEFVCRMWVFLNCLSVACVPHDELVDCSLSSVFCRPFYYIFSFLSRVAVKWKSKLMNPGLSWLLGVVLCFER